MVEEKVGVNMNVDIFFKEYKKDLLRLRNECSEKTSKIIALGEKIDVLIEENKKLKAIIFQAVKDFNLELGTPHYDNLVQKAKELGMYVSDYEL